MKLTITILALLLGTGSSVPTQTSRDYGLPELHKITSATLSPSYGCRSEQEFHKGYQQTALFLSAYSKQRNAPELLFNGACKSADNFEAATAGDDLDLVADYGKWPIEDLTAQQVFSPQMRVSADANFSRTVPVVEGHTYGLLINKSDVRGFFFFQVLRHVQNQKVEVKYVVEDYQILNQSAQAPGFGWDIKSHY
jgi:hypothetical protein